MLRWTLAGLFLPLCILACASNSDHAAKKNGNSTDAQGGSSAASGGSNAEDSHDGSGGNDAEEPCLQDCDANTEDGIAGGENCDATLVLSKALPPPCESGMLPSVKGTQWSGECVPLNECGCETSGSQEQCGDGTQYVCYSSNRCGDLVR